tara:strand:- start:257 stop:568 length:312 start_codon:yes stop_codon:yes gene_type:complete
MPYYFFNRAANIEELSDIARRLGLKEHKFFQEEYEWGGRPFIDEEWFLKVTYYKDDSTPLLIMTPTDHSNFEVMDILQQYIRICEPTKITNECRVPYDMNDFN